jgi:hypothetical protein
MHRVRLGKYSIWLGGVCIVSEAARLTDIKPTWSHRGFKTPPHGLLQEKVLIATTWLSQKFRDDIATIKSIEAVPSILQAVCHATGMGRRCRVAPTASSESHGKVTG